MKTTLNKIRKHSPCEDGWKKLLNTLGKTKADDEPLPILTVLDSNGLDDALWCLRAVEGYEKEIQLYAVWCARQVQHLMTDPRSIAALDVAEAYSNGQATEEELAAARDAARDAARAAAWSAAMDAARAAWAAAWAAAVDAAVDAAANAAVDAAGNAAWAAAVDAAVDAAWAAAMDAAMDAAVAAARDAAGAAARDVQEQQLRLILSQLGG